MNKERAKKLLREFNFQSLFLDELGWDAYASPPLPLGNGTITLRSIAQKKGMPAYLCPDTFDYPTRCKLEAQLAKCVREHLIVYVNQKHGLQIWQWVKREPGKPLARREHSYTINQAGDSLVQKLEYLEVTLAEEEQTTLPDVTSKVKRAFDLEKITKRFYDRFKTEHAAFLKFIEGIPDKDLERWYASVMINRLMFIYFIQKKGFLDNDPDYLRTKLNLTKDFYKDFLCPLFFDGFAKKESERSSATNRLLGAVPYLNGGIFQPHPIEQRYGKTIEISNKAFVQLFAFFNAYHWHLDDRPTHNDNEIRPDVLGYIFEKYINQKQMGAYYTKEDITEYISKNTIIPRLFDMAKAKCKVAFEGGHSLWNLLKADPDRYIYDAAKHGTDTPLPDGIAVGLKDVSQRTQWNTPADAAVALPTEIWRETVARRQRCEDVRRKLADGQAREINDLVTLNLNIRQFAQDVLESCEGPELLVAFWNALAGITVLDPTCGSGAFLFAALNILEPLYEACLDRMQAFLNEWAEPGKTKHPNYHKLFSETLARVDAHPNRRYFVFKSIIVGNLYGVDIMDEAVEICKLRLFLKLVAQVDTAGKIEPLPDIDFNIRAGNALVGFATQQQVETVLSDDLLAYSTVLPNIIEQAEDIDALFSRFREQQIALGGEVTPEDKAELRKKLGLLEAELNQYLAQYYKVDVNKKTALEQWIKSHQPFHWFIDFYGIMNRGGFEVIIGNPPYLETREVDYEPKNYDCLGSGAIHAMCIERSVQLLHHAGCMSMIVPLSLPSTQRMEIVQKILEAKRNAWYSNFAWRPAKLFDTVNRALTIFVLTSSDDGHTFSTNYQKWTSDNRGGLMERLNYVEVLRQRPACWIPKLGDSIEQHILKKCHAVKTVVKNFTSKSAHRIYYRTTGGLYWKVFTDFAPAFNLEEKKGHSSRETWFSVGNKEHVKPVIAALSSDVFWWWYTVTTNVRDLNPFDIQNFPVPESALADSVLQVLGTRYLKDLARNSTMLVREQKQTGTTETQSFKIQKSKAIIDDIDAVLAKHYGFTDEELDFIINYDIKYRMGLNGDAGVGGEDE